MSDSSKVKIAVIPAAGLGTRMLPATKAVPKEMLPVAGKPLIQYAVEEAAGSGIETVILVIRDNKSLIQAHFAPDPALETFLNGRKMKKEAEVVRRLTNLVDVRYVRQDQPLGLAHALCAAQPLVKQEPFAVLLPDVIMVTDEPVTRQLIRCRELHGGSVVAIREVAQHDVERHGIVEVSRLSNSNSDKAARVTRLVEKPSAATAPSRLGVFGRYLLEPAIWDAIAQTKPDAHGEIQLTDALNLLCQTSLLVGLCFDGQHHDAGDQFGFIKANLELSLQYVRLREHS